MAHPGPPRCVCQHDNRHQTPPTPPPPGAATDCTEARRYILVIACPLPLPPSSPASRRSPFSAHSTLSAAMLSLSRPSLHPCYRHHFGLAQSGSFRNAKNHAHRVASLFPTSVSKSISRIDFRPRLFCFSADNPPRIILLLSSSFENSTPPLSFGNKTWRQRERKREERKLRRVTGRIVSDHRKGIRARHPATPFPPPPSSSESIAFGANNAAQPISPTDWPDLRLILDDGNGHLQRQDTQAVHSRNGGRTDGRTDRQTKPGHAYVPPIYITRTTSPVIRRDSGLFRCVGAFRTVPRMR